MVTTFVGDGYTIFVGNYFICGRALLYLWELLWALQPPPPPLKEKSPASATGLEDTVNISPNMRFWNLCNLQLLGYEFHYLFIYMFRR